MNRHADMDRGLIAAQQLISLFEANDEPLDKAVDLQWRLQRIFFDGASHDLSAAPDNNVALVAPRVDYSQRLYL